MLCGQQFQDSEIPEIVPDVKTSYENTDKIHTVDVISHMP